MKETEARLEAAEASEDCVRDWFATDPRADTDSGSWDYWNDALSAFDALVARLAETEARLEAAEKALEPFARDAEAFDCRHPYGDGPVFERLTLRHRWYFTVTDIQCARRALAGKDV